MIDLVILPGTAKDISELQEKAIALDGVVQGPFIDHQNRRYSFDHHGTVQRLCTSSTAKQVLDSLILGFEPEGYKVFINHTDLDSVLSVYLLENPHLMHNPQLVGLIRDINDFDVHGPIYPIERRDIVDWLEEPFKEVKRNNKANDLSSLKWAFDEITRRLVEKFPPNGQPVLGEGSESDLEAHAGYKIEYVGEGGWILAKRLNPANEPAGYDPILELYKKGYDKIVLYQLSGDRRKATICKRSDFVDFPVGPGDVPDTILFALDDIEKGWGGGSTIGGSPREFGGTSLSLEKICSVIDNKVIKTRKARRELITPDDIQFLVDSYEADLPIPERVLKNIGLAFVLEPIPDKRGCTTRYRDLKPTITLEMLSSAAVNSSLAYLHLARYCLEHQKVEGSYRFLLEAMTYSKWARGGGKTNQGMLEFTIPIIAAQMLYDPRGEKDPFELLITSTGRLHETSRDDVKFLIETKKRGNIFSNVQDKYPVNEHPEAQTVFEYYAEELAEERSKGYGTGIVHNMQFVDNFRDVAIMLGAFNDSKGRFCDRVNVAYETMLENQAFKPIGKGLAADLVATMLYLAFTYSRGEPIVK